MIILVSKCQIILNDTQHSSSKRNSIQLVKKDENDLVLFGPKNNYTTTNIKQNCLTKIINISYSIDYSSVQFELGRFFANRLSPIKRRNRTVSLPFRFMYLVSHNSKARYFSTEPFHLKRHRFQTNYFIKLDVN